MDPMQSYTTGAFCFHCGKALFDDGDRRSSGCICCTTNCPRCGNIVPKDKITHNGDEAYCFFCEDNYLKEKRQQELTEQELSAELEDVSNLSTEELKQKLQGANTHEINTRLRKIRIEILKNMTKVNGEPLPKNIDKISDEELDKIIKAQFEKAMKIRR